MDLHIFQTYRIQLMRENDERPFAGFVEFADNQFITVRVQGSTHVTPGEEFNGSIIIHGRRAEFTARATEINDDFIKLEVTSTLELSKTSQSGRRKVNFQQSVQCGGVQVKVQIRDVAPEGIGFLSSCPFAIGEIVEVGFPIGPVTHMIPFEVCHSRHEQVTSKFHVGCKLSQQNQMKVMMYQLAIQKDDPLFDLIKTEKSA